MRWSCLKAGAIAALAAACLAIAPARAQQEVKIGVGFGISFLPVYLVDELKLIEKHGKDAGLDLKTTYHRFSGSGPMQDAIISGAIDMGPLGTSAILTVREKARGTPQEMLTISGVATLPLVLITNQQNIKKLSDFKASDRISMPSIVSPQMYLLQMQAEKEFGPGQHDKMKPQVIALPHPESLNALVSGSTEVTAYFSPPPFTQAALKTGKVSRVLSSTDIMGKASFIIMGASKRFVDANPKIPPVVAKAIEEAAALIKNEPARAAEIYLKREPSKLLDQAAMESILKEYADDFGSSVHGVQAYADFMGRLGQLKNPPKSWKEIVTPSIANTQSD
jgi:NitT/TauT family transport system substrate-binding protein